MRETGGMAGSEGGWIEILDVGTMQLWDDAPPAATMTLAASAAELEGLVDSFIEALPRDALAISSRYRGLDAEVSAGARAANSVTVYQMIVTPGTAPARLHTGNGVCAWIRPGDSIRIVGFA